MNRQWAMETEAPRDGPPVHTLNKACVAVYPSIVQNGILWFWPNSDDEYKDIVTKKKPPCIPELDDPSFTYQMFCRDIPYGYWSHVVNCSSCNGAYKGLKVLKVCLQVASVASVAMLVATKQGMISVAASNTFAVAAVLWFVGSKWLSYFVYKNFHYHGYDHAFK
ncbi:hypothetical protein QVD17_37561 [Tagetes erecta]|uniref:Uncharacterized protein n=1 Tax=Tagetes erecta TaxID=13708 RepID=A0AAD8NJA7_TARER|nr:hypothetical protein QVD17_37561 [Tagetes erecta]